MTDIVDQYNDPTFVHLHVLTREKPLARQLLKTASFSKEAAAELPSSAFAWPEARRFAIHSKEDTLASLLYREKCASVPPHVDKMLEKAAQIYGLGDHVFANTKTASAPGYTYNPRSGVLSVQNLTPDMLINPEAHPQEISSLMNGVREVREAELARKTAAAGMGQPISAFAGGQKALKTQGYFRNPNNPNDVYLSDKNIAKLQSNDPAQIREVINLTRPQDTQAMKTGSAPNFLTKHGSSGYRRGLYALPEDERLPINTAPEVKLAEHVLNRDFERLPIEKRAEAYSRLTTAAQLHDVALSDFTLKMAGMVACSSDVLRDSLETRATAAGPGAVRVAFDKLANELSKAPPILHERQDLTKLAGVIHELDKKAGLERHYDRKLLDPMQTVFNTNIKLGEEMCDVAGSAVPCSTLMALPDRVWDMLDVPELKECCEQGDAATFKQIFETLPLDLKVALKAHL